MCLVFRVTLDEDGVGERGGGDRGGVLSAS